MLLSGSGGQDARSRPGRPAGSRSQRHQAKPGARTPGNRRDCPMASQVLQPARPACQQAGCRNACHRAPPACSFCIVLTAGNNGSGVAGNSLPGFIVERTLRIDKRSYLKRRRSLRGVQSQRLPGNPQRCGEDGGPGEGSRDAALRERRAGMPARDRAVRPGVGAKGTRQSLARGRPATAGIVHRHRRYYSLHDRPANRQGVGMPVTGPHPPAPLALC